MDDIYFGKTNLMPMLYEILSIRTHHDFDSMLRSIQTMFNCDGVFFAQIDRISQEVDKIHCTENLGDWLETYLTHNLQDIDPVFKNLLKSKEKILPWSSFIFTEINSPFFDLASEYHMTNGISIQTKIGLRLYILAVRVDSEKDESILLESRKVIKIIGTLISAVYHDIFNSTKSLVYKLTDKEQRIFQWLLLGKSNGEIAQILGLRERNIKQTIEHLLVVFDASNRIHLVKKLLTEYL